MASEMALCATGSQLNFKRWHLDVTVLYQYRCAPDGFNKAHLHQFGEILQAWMLSQIPARVNTDLA